MEYACFNTVRCTTELPNDAVANCRHTRSTSSRLHPNSVPATQTALTHSVYLLTPNIHSPKRYLSTHKHLHRATKHVHIPLGKGCPASPGAVASSGDRSRRSSTSLKESNCCFLSFIVLDKDGIPLAAVCLVFA